MTTAAPPFQRFLLEHRDAVLRLLVGMVGPADAEDCFQESFLKALRGWPPADLDGRLDSWMLTIAHRTALGHLRRRGVTDIALDDAGELDAHAEPDEVGAGLLGLWAKTPAGLWAAVGGSRCASEPLSCCASCSTSCTRRSRPCSSATRRPRVAATPTGSPHCAPASQTEPWRSPDDVRRTAGPFD